MTGNKKPSTWATRRAAFSWAGGGDGLGVYYSNVRERDFVRLVVFS